VCTNNTRICMAVYQFQKLECYSKQSGLFIDRLRQRALPGRLQVWNNETGQSLSEEIVNTVIVT